MASLSAGGALLIGGPLITEDAEISVEVLLCALAVAPSEDPQLRLMLLAGLKARYAKLTRDPDTYPPSRYPWNGRTAPGADMLEYLGA